MITSNDVKQRILWLSDIHYLKEYVNKTDEFKKYIADFITVCQSNNTPAIDYVLISGDIAQSGEEIEYRLFKEDILDKIFEVLPTAKLLIIPGNHDVSRTSISYFENYFKKDNDKFTEKSEFVAKNKTAFDHIFKDYKAAFKDSPYLPVEGLSPYYTANLYHGYYKDDNNKTIFVLLNSSWLSFGEESLKHYLKENINIGSKKSNPDKICYEALARDITLRTHEYGNQIVSMNVFTDYGDLKNQIDNYPEYLIITVMHHPINWLASDEQVNYANDPQSPFFFLRQKTNLLLTGHEHVPYMHLPEIHNDLTSIHIPGGAFIQVKKKNKISKDSKKPKKTNTSEDPEEMTYKFENTMFSIMDINVKKRTIKNKKFIYENNTWINKRTDSFILEKNYLEELSDERKNIILNKLDKHITKKTIIGKLYKDTTLISEEKIYLKNKCNEVYIFVEKEFDFNISNLKSIIKNNNVCVINFVFIDIKFDNGKMYKVGNDRLVVLNKIKTSMELRFNRFRHKFFSNPKPSEMLDFSDIKFVLIVKPYWEVEFFL